MYTNMCWNTSRGGWKWADQYKSKTNGSFYLFEYNNVRIQTLFCIFVQIHYFGCVSFMLQANWTLWRVFSSNIKHFSTILKMKGIFFINKFILIHIKPLEKPQNSKNILITLNNATVQSGFFEMDLNHSALNCILTEFCEQHFRLHKNVNFD